MHILFTCTCTCTCTCTYVLIAQANNNITSLLNVEHIGGEQTNLSIWSKVVIVLVKVVDCRSEFLFMVNGCQAHKVQLYQTTCRYMQIFSH